MDYEKVKNLSDIICGEFGETFCGIPHEICLLLAKSGNGGSASDWLRMTQRAALNMERKPGGLRYNARELLAAALEVAEYYDTQTEEPA
jgi:hypothetical protein